MATTTTTPAVTTLTVESFSDESVKARTFTAENAEKGLAGAKSARQKVAFVKGAVEAYKESDALRQTAAAYATKCMLLEGMQQKDIAAVLDLSPASITQYKRMAKAYDLGARPGTDVWRILGSGAGAQDAKVAEVIMDKGATLAKVEKAAAAFDATKGAAKKVAKKVTKKAGGSTNQTDSTTTPVLTKRQQAEQGLVKEPREVPAMLDMISRMLTEVEGKASGKGLSPAAVKRLEGFHDRIGTLIHPEESAESAS